MAVSDQPDLADRANAIPPGSEPNKAQGRPAADFLKSDLDRAVDYRKEYYKYVIAIATALLAFTVSFPPQLSRPPEMTWLILAAWAFLGLAVLAGVRVHMTWAKFFISFRDFDNKGKKDEGRKVRELINLERHILDVFQIIGLVVGVIGIVLFAGSNLKYLAPRTEAKVTAIETATDAPTNKVVEERSGDTKPIAPSLIPGSTAIQ